MATASCRCLPNQTGGPNSARCFPTVPPLTSDVPQEVLLGRVTRTVANTPSVQTRKMRGGGSKGWGCVRLGSSRSKTLAGLSGARQWCNAGKAGGCGSSVSPLSL